MDVFEHNLGFNGGLDLKFGRYSDFINFSIGATYNYVSGMKSDDSESKEITINQVVFPAVLRFNLFKIGSGTKFYIVGGFSYNLNISDIIKDDSDSMSSNPSGYKVESSNMTGYGAIGVNWRTGTFAIYYKQHITDLYKQQGHVSPDVVDSHAKQVDEKFWLGAKYTWYIPLTK